MAIPGSYNHLRVIGIARSSQVAQFDNWSIQFNGDSGGNYDEEYVIGINVTASANLAGADDFFGVLSDIPGASATAGVAGSFIMDIPLYAGTHWQKKVSILYNGTDTAKAAADSNVMATSGCWRSAAAINEIDIGLATGPNFKAGSAFYLYGII